MYPEAVKRLEEAQQAKEAKYNKPKPVDDDDDDGAGERMVMMMVK